MPNSTISLKVTMSDATTYETTRTLTDAAVTRIIARCATDLGLTAVQLLSNAMWQLCRRANQITVNREIKNSSGPGTTIPISDP